MMKKLNNINILLTTILILFLLINNMYAASNAEDKSDDIKITMAPNNVYNYKANDVIFTIESSKSKKKWTFTAEEIIKWKIAGFNWDIVENSDPKIRDVYEDDNYLYIVFGYSTITPKEFFGIQVSKKDDYILSGKILIHKKYLVNDKMQKCNVTFYKSASIGLLVYSIAVTILCAILAL